MIGTEERAAELYGIVRGCQLCVLAQTRTQAVPGEGPLDAEVICIGEAPGVNEDKQGRPFVGAAGQFLGELLGAAGLTREEVYICNVLKCRPPGNRDPLPGEIEACAEYLDLQIDMVDPLVIVTLGRFSMARWFPQQAISRIHGTVKEVDGRFVVPMYHPAAALHQGNLRQVLLDDFAKLPGILERARGKRLRAPDLMSRTSGVSSQASGTSSHQPLADEPALAHQPPGTAYPAPGTDDLSATQSGPAPEQPAAAREEPRPAEQQEQIRLFE